MNFSELLRYQEKALGASISVESRHPAFSVGERLKLAPDQFLHHLDYCRHAKLSRNSACFENKRRSIAVAQCGRCFSGCCPYGVWELACPFRFDGELAGILYFGGFRKPGVSLSFPEFSLPAITDECRRQLHEAAEFDLQYLQIEYALYRQSGGLTAKQQPQNYYVQSCRAFIDQHYPDPISLKELAQHLKVHPNYLGALLKHSTGATFRELLTDRRLHEAEIYLKLHPALSIAQIAYRCGFQDSNYFSTVFRRRRGASPLACRAR